MKHKERDTEEKGSVTGKQQERIKEEKKCQNSTVFLALQPPLQGASNMSTAI